jgi:restriction endonuclease S subunit
LEGLEITVLKFSEITDIRFRFDSEYYQKEFIKNELILKSNFKINDFVKNNIANIKQIKLNKNFNYLEISNVSLTNLTYNTVEIDFNEIPDRATYILNNGDVVVSTVRPNRNAVALIRNSKRIIGTSGFTVLRTNNKINSEYLFAFCKTKFFITKLIRENTATMYPAVNDSDILNVSIPIFSNNFNNEIKKLIDNASNKLFQSQSLYAAAEQNLLEILGLANWQPTEENTSIKTFSNSFGTSGRLDAEYYQPKYDEIEEKIKMYAGGFELFSAIINSQDKNYNPIEDVEYKYIELSDIGNSGEVTSATVDLGKNLPTRARRIVKTGDVIISSIEGSLSKCALITEEYNNSLCSTGFYVINSTGILPEVLILLFKSFPYQELLKGRCNGTILTAISQEELKTIPIPILPMDKQKELSAQIQESFKNRQESSRLIEIAKQAVEMAIEQDEQTAMKFIKDNDFVA